MPGYLHQEFGVGESPCPLILKISSWQLFILSRLDDSLRLLGDATVRRFYLCNARNLLSFVKFSALPNREMGCTLYSQLPRVWDGYSQLDGIELRANEANEAKEIEEAKQAKTTVRNFGESDPEKRMHLSFPAL